MKFIHSADWQLGMCLHFLDDDARAAAREARLDVIDRIGALARAHGAQFVLVAGDCFDSNTLDSRTVIQACDRIAEIALPVYLIPGNHDHGGPGSVYLSAQLAQQRPANLHLLLTTEPVLVAGGQAVILPAPLLRRSESADVTRHFDAELGRSAAPGAIRIGLAHGSVIGFESDGEAKNNIDPTICERAALDYLALGDWHGTRQISARVWYSGTPEPTSFKDNAAGQVLRVEIERPGAVPQVAALATGHFRWQRHAAELTSAADVELLQRFVDALPAPRDTLLRLELSGTLPAAARQRLDAVLTQARGRLRHLRERGTGVLVQPTDPELAALASSGFVKAAIDELRNLASVDGPTGEPAREALYLLYRLQAETETAPCD